MTNVIYAILILLGLLFIYNVCSIRDNLKPPRALSSPEEAHIDDIKILFPPIFMNYNLTAIKSAYSVTEQEVYEHLNAGGFLIGSNNEAIINQSLETLIEYTKANGALGYPDFYHIFGPVLIMAKEHENYFWMTDYPIKYTPANYNYHVGTSTNWNTAKMAFEQGKRLLDINAPVIFFNYKCER